MAAGWVERAWVEDGPAWRLARALLSPFAALYGFGAARRNAAFDAGTRQAASLADLRVQGARSGARVVSVGNLVVGGTGKSPVVVRLAEALRKQGFRPAILARGYGSPIPRGDSLALIGPEVRLAAASGAPPPDEARMQAAQLRDVPVVCGPDRLAAARRFLEALPEAAPTHWLLDDGFQHRELARDLDIVLLDASRPFGSGSLLPSGNLREAPSGLARAHAVVFTRADAEKGLPAAASVAEVRRLAPKAVLLDAPFTARPLVESVDGIRFDKALHEPLLPVCGIAGPATFLAELERHGHALVPALIVGDHASIPVEALAARLAAPSAPQGIVTTAKDYWRDPARLHGLSVPVFVRDLEVGLSVERVLALLAPVS
jgi:tetraacyldisaccharide 4'-kinase